MVQLQDIVSTAATVVGILLGFTPIVPFVKIIQGKEKYEIFPESMIILGIVAPMLWGIYWIRLGQYIPFISCGVGIVQGTIFAVVYIYFYFNKNKGKWFLGFLLQILFTGGLYFLLMDVIPTADMVGKCAIIFGVITNIAPAQNIVRVCREKSYKLIPIASTACGLLCTSLWLIFGILIKDYNSSFVNVINAIIQTTNCSIWAYFYCTRKEDEEKEGDNTEELKPSE